MMPDYELARVTSWEGKGASSRYRRGFFGTIDTGALLLNMLLRSEADLRTAKGSFTGNRSAHINSAMEYRRYRRTTNRSR